MQPHIVIFEILRHPKEDCLGFACVHVHILRGPFDRRWGVKHLCVGLVCIDVERLQECLYPVVSILVAIVVIVVELSCDEYCKCLAYLIL